MLLATLALITGLALLLWSAERFVDGAVATAHHLRLPPLVIGTVIVGIGTSAPEFLISSVAAWSGESGLAIGNAYGSNTANIGLILGVALLISPMRLRTGLMRPELILLLVFTLLSRWFIADGRLGRVDALLLVIALIGFITATLWSSARDTAAAASAGVDETAQAPALSRIHGLCWLAIGLLLLVASSRLLVWGAVQFASALGVSDLVIGLTVVAIGTSLPELASSLSALRRNQYELVLGNVVGSNLFNTLGVVGVAGLLTPIAIAGEVVHRDWPVMAVMTLLLAVFALRFGRRPARLTRAHGALLLVAFLGYNAWLVAGVLEG